MRRITVELPDGHDDLVSITAVGQTMMRVNLMVQAVDLNGHDGETLVIRPNESHEWRKPETGWIQATERLPEYVGNPDRLSVAEEKPEEVPKSESYTVIEWCPHCENEVEVEWDLQKDGYEIFCPYCGKRILICSECPMVGSCDWDEKQDAQCEGTARSKP